MARLTPNSIGAAVRELLAPDLPALSRLFASDPARFRSLEAGFDMCGLRSDSIRFYGVPEESGPELRAVLIRLRSTLVCADRDGTSGRAIAAFIDEQPAVTGLRLCLETLESVQVHLRRYRPSHRENSWFMELHGTPAVDPQMPRARRASTDDVAALAELYAGSGMVPRAAYDLERQLATGRVFVVDDLRDRNRIASAAMLNAEGRSACIVGSVYTTPDARGRGFAAACTSAISQDVIDSGKLPCLFYENEAAGRIYRRLGYQMAGEWAVLYVGSLR